MSEQKHPTDVGKKATPRGSPALIVFWERVIHEMLSRTESFPKRVRMTFSVRLDNGVLRIYEHLLEARYSKQPADILHRINLELDKVRCLLRLSYERKFLPERGLRVMIELLDEAGRMVGGWLKQSRSS